MAVNEAGTEKNRVPAGTVWGCTASSAVEGLGGSFGARAATAWCWLCVLECFDPVLEPQIWILCGGEPQRCLLFLHRAFFCA